MIVFPYVLIYIFFFLKTSDSFLECAEKKEIQFLFRLGYIDKKRLWCTTDTQMYLVFSSITVNLHSNFLVFQYMSFCYVGTKYYIFDQVLSSLNIKRN